jgi:hypothetical protein
VKAMKKLILIIGIIYSCYAQRVESLMNLTVKGSTCLPTLSPFLSNLWIFHTRDSVYGIYSNSYENKIFRGAGVGLEYSVTYDFFLDSATSMVANVGIVKYYIYNSTILAIKDSILPSFNVYAMDPLSKLLLAPDSDKKSFLIKRINYNNRYEIIEEEPIIKIFSPDSTIINWQLRFAANLQYWSVWQIVNWYYQKGGALICLNRDKKIIKMLQFIPGAPGLEGYGIVWERFELPNVPYGYGVIRMRVVEDEMDIKVEIIDTLASVVFPLGSTYNYTVWGITRDDSVYIEAIDKNNNKMTILKVPNQSKDKNRARTLSLSYAPVPNSIIVNIYFTHEDYSTTDNKIFKISFPYTFVSNNTNIPTKFILYQNYPNPFNPSTTIEFDIPEKTDVKLIVYDILGREVETLIDKELEPGKYKVNFEAKDLPSGVYFYTLRAPKLTKTNKMILIK